MMEMVHETGCLRGLDLVEVNPALAKNEEEIWKTVDAAKRLILAAAGFPRGVSAI
jgi:arginase family enzyme